MYARAVIQIIQIIQIPPGKRDLDCVDHVHEGSVCPD